MVSGERPTARWPGSCHGPIRRISSGTLGLPPRRSRLPSPEQAKPGTMPPDDRLRLDDHQGIQHTERNSIETGKNEPVKLLKTSRFGDLLAAH